MKKDGFYSSGEFAKMAHITKKTLRYYDAHNILKPSYLTPYGARFYSDEDFARLQQILLLKYLGFSLDDIREMTINDSDYHFMANALKLQQKLVQDKIFPHASSFTVSTAQINKAGFRGFLNNAIWKIIQMSLRLAAVMVLYGLRIRKRFQNSSMLFSQIFQKECFVIPGV